MAIYRDRQSVFQPALLIPDRETIERNLVDRLTARGPRTMLGSATCGECGSHDTLSRRNCPRRGTRWRRTERGMPRRLFLDARRAGNNLSAVASINNSYAPRWSRASLRSCRPNVRVWLGVTHRATDTRQQNGIKMHDDAPSRPKDVPFRAPCFSLLLRPWERFVGEGG